MRLAPNDEANSQLLMGVMHDMGGDENIASVEASRRFGANWKLILDAWFFLNTPSGTLLHGLQDDDFVRLQLAYYF
jgi:hypothetical protein